MNYANRAYRLIKAHEAGLITDAEMDREEAELLGLMLLAAGVSP